VRATLALPLGASLALTPDLAAACATCLDSAWGDRGFGWPFVVLMLAPFAVVLGLVAVLAWGRRRQPRPADD